MKRHMYVSSGFVRACAFFVSGALAGCGGTGTTVPSSGGSALAPLRIVLQVPPLMKQSIARIPKYVSPGTQGLGIDYATGSNPTFTPSQIQSPPVAFDLSSCINTSLVSCTSNSDGSHTYTLTVAIPPSSSTNPYTLLVTAWDAPPGTGGFPTSAHQLSQQTISNVSINAGAQNTVSLSLNGIPASISLVPLPAQSHVVPFTGTGGFGYAIIGNGPVFFQATALDADGFQIVGPGAPSVTMSDGTGTFTVTSCTTPATNPERCTLEAISVSGTVVNSGVGLTLTATPPSGSGLSPLMLTTTVYPIQELWITHDAGTPPYGVFGYPLFPPTFLPPNQPIDAYIDNGSLCGSTTGNCGLTYLASDPILSGSSAPLLWFTSSYNNSYALYPLPVPSYAFAPSVTSPTIGLSSPPTAIAADAAGNVYVTTASGGSGSFYIYNPATSTSPLVTYNPSPPPTPINLTLTIAPAVPGIPTALQGTLWSNPYGSCGNSPVSVFSQFTGGNTMPAQIQCSNITVSSSLQSALSGTTLYQLAFDENGYLWFVTGSSIVAASVSGTQSAMTLSQVATTSCPIASGTSPSYSCSTSGGFGIAVTGSGSSEAWPVATGLYTLTPFVLSASAGTITMGTATGLPQAASTIVTP